jgi:hypothetical protein
MLRRLLSGLALLMTPDAGGGGGAGGGSVGGAVAEAPRQPLAAEVQQAIGAAVSEAVAKALPAMATQIGQATLAAAREQAAGEAARVSAIETAASRFASVPGVADLVTQAKAAGISEQAFATKLLDVVAASHQPLGGAPVAGEFGSLTAADVAVGQSGAALQRERIANGLVAQHNPEIMNALMEGGERGNKVAQALGYETSNAGLNALSGAQREFGGMRLQHAASACLRADKLPSWARTVNGTLRLDGQQLAAFAFSHGTSDFPELTANVMRKSMAGVFAAVNPIWRSIARKGSSPDFKERSVVTLSEIGDLQAIPEGGSVVNTTISERGERIGLTTFARGISVTRQLLINDDMGGFTALPAAFARAAARAPDQLVADLINNNRNLRSNNQPFFNESVHENLDPTPAALSFASLERMITAMRNRRAWMNPQAFQEVSPHVLLVPASLEFYAKKMLASTTVFDGRTANRTDKEPNVLPGYLPGGVVGTARLTGNGYTLFANPSEQPAIEVNFLNGNESPTISFIDTGSQLGLTYEVIFDLGVAWVTPEAAYRNAGV